MISVDTNVLLHGHRSDSPWHARASEKLSGLAASGHAWAIPWPCIHEFLAIATHPRIFEPPTPLAEALLAVDSWLACPTLRLLGESGGYWQVLREAIAGSRVAGPRIHDARVVALCLQHGVTEIWAADRDFSRFRGVKVANPLT